VIRPQVSVERASAHEYLDQVQPSLKDGTRDISAAIIHPSAQKSACYGREARRVHKHVSRFLE
jgi:hypothetical protein